MPNEELIVNRVVVGGAALIYWAGVYIQTRRIRHRIGRAPNVKPRGTKEKVLWLGWFLVVMTWLALPFLAGTRASTAWLRIMPSLSGTVWMGAGIALTAAGYAGTLWCYVIMGNAWRMGVDRAEKNRLVTAGPYRVVRHPIYLFQILMLAGTALLLPTIVSWLVLVFHGLCIHIKATDEEAYLRTVHGADYDNYCSRTGRFFPKLVLRSGL